MAWLERFTSRWNDYQCGWLMGLIAPVFMGVVSLHVIRISQRGLATSFVWAPDLIRPLACFWIGLAGLGTTYLGLSDERRDGRERLFFLQLLVVPVVMLEILGHAFFMSTGAVLDATLVSRGLLVLNNQPDVLWSEARPRYLAALGLGVVTATGLPWIVAEWGSQSVSDGERPDLVERPLRTALISVFAVAAGAWPSPVVADAWLSRPATINVTAGFVHDLGETWRTRPSGPTPAEDLELVRRDTSGESPDHVALIILESLRARSTSLVDSGPPTTPYLAKLAETSTVSTRSYAVVPHTSKALVAMICGTEPSLRMELDALQGIPARCLPELLGDSGYRTIFFQSATDRFENRGKLLERMGFDHFRPLETMNPRPFEAVNYFGVEDNVMLEPSRTWLKRQKDRNSPFLATYLTVTPHHPYTVPSTYERRTFVEPADGRLNRYLNTLYYLDRFVERLIAQYKSLGLYEETLFVVAGDHGEAFGEHGHYHHDSVIYEEGIRSILLAHDPTTPDDAARRITPNVTQLDILPTIVDRLGFEAARGTFRGTSIDDLDGGRPMYASCYFERRCMTRIVGDDKYVYQFGKAPEAFYDLADDPMERRNLAEQRDDLDEWRRALLQWRRRINARYLGAN